jgi:hypothetical protein
MTKEEINILKVISAICFLIIFVLRVFFTDSKGIEYTADIFSIIGSLIVGIILGVNFNNR